MNRRVISSGAELALEPSGGPPGRLDAIGVPFEMTAAPQGPKPYDLPVFVRFQRFGEKRETERKLQNRSVSI
jgi:hypothetical protein